MKLSLKLSIITLVIIATAITTIFLMNKESNEIKVESSTPVDAKAQKQAKMKKWSEQLKNAQALKQVEQVKKIEKEIEKELPSRYKKLLKAVRGAETKINFYGKVIDQNGLPVSDAKIKYTAIGMHHLTQSNKGIITTNNQGTFSIKTKGYTLTLNSLKQAEVSDAYLANERDSTSLRFERNEWPNYTVDNPYLILVWRPEKFEHIIHGSGNFRGSPNDKTYTIMGDSDGIFIRKRIDNSGYFLLLCTHDENAYEQKLGDWSFTLKAIDGGIQEAAADDLYLNKAPEGNYQTQITVSMLKNNTNYTDRLSDKKYYFTAQNGQAYGSMVLEFNPYAKRRSCSLHIKYKINPNGSRNLAYRKK